MPRPQIQMDDSPQEATSLSQYHWLFSDEPDTALSYRSMVPRVLTYEPISSLPASCAEDVATNLQAQRSHNQAITRLMQPKPCHPASTTYFSGLAIEAPSDLVSNSSLHNFSDVSQPIYSHDGQKRCREMELEEEYQCQKRLRSSSLDSTVGLKSDIYPAHSSPKLSTASTACPSAASCESLIDLNSLAWRKEMDMLGLKVELAAAQAQNAADNALVSDTKECLAFLMNEFRRVIASASHRDSADRLYQVIDAADHRLKDFLEAFPTIKYMASSMHNIDGPAQEFTQSSISYPHEETLYLRTQPPKKLFTTSFAPEDDCQINIAFSESAGYSAIQSEDYDLSRCNPNRDAHNLPFDPMQESNWNSNPLSSRQPQFHSATHSDRRQEAEVYCHPSNYQSHLSLDLNHQLPCAPASTFPHYQAHERWPNPCSGPPMPLVNHLN